MKKPIRSSQPVTMMHHIREMRTRFLVVVCVLILSMIIGYYFYEPLFHFIKTPLSGPLHYMAPSGSFSFVIKICLLTGAIITLPVIVYNCIMFVQPALKKQLSRLRVYTTTFLSLIFATAGAAFAFFIIIPLALRFFYKFQVDGLVAMISADSYLQFVTNVIITFVIIFQLPLFLSFIDHIWPLPPKKLLKAEKYVIVGSLVVGVCVPFALDPAVQLLIASPIIVLYNLSVGVIILQHSFKKRKRIKTSRSAEPIFAKSQTHKPQGIAKVASVDIIRNLPASPNASPAAQNLQTDIHSSQRLVRQPKRISDIRPVGRKKATTVTTQNSYESAK